MSTAKKAETILSGLLALLERSGNGVIVQAEEDTGLDAPVVVYSPFVMNTSQKMQTAVADVWAGRFGQLG